MNGSIELDGPPRWPLLACTIAYATSVIYLAGPITNPQSESPAAVRARGRPATIRSADG